MGLTFYWLVQGVFTIMNLIFFSWVKELESNFTMKIFMGIKHRYKSIN